MNSKEIVPVHLLSEEDKNATNTKKEVARVYLVKDLHQVFSLMDEVAETFWDGYLF